MRTHRKHLCGELADVLSCNVLQRLLAPEVGFKGSEESARGKPAVLDVVHEGNRLEDRPAHCTSVVLDMDFYGMLGGKVVHFRWLEAVACDGRVDEVPRARRLRSVKESICLTRLGFHCVSLISS
jgi:hypothetical protein